MLTEVRVSYLHASCDPIHIALLALLLQRVAETKFVRSKSVKDHAEAIRAMMGRHILPFAERDNGNVYRRARMFTEEVRGRRERHTALNVLTRLLHRWTWRSSSNFHSSKLCMTQPVRR